MRLIKLTDIKDKSIYVSADQIVSCEWGEMTRYTEVYTSLRGQYFRVKETPEQIERLANSRQTDFTDYGALIQFAKWLHEKGNLLLGKSYTRAVDQYILESESK